MNEAMSMHLAKTFDHRHYQRTQGCFIDSAVLFQVGSKVNTLLELHHHIGGVVLLKNRHHTHDIRVLETNQIARFFDESLKTPAVQITVLFGDR